MSGYCKDCGNQHCVCDDPKSHPEIRNYKRMLRDGTLTNTEDYEYKDVNDILPLKFDTYLVRTEFGNYTIMLYDYQGWDSISKGKPTHWMVIPKVKDKSL
jgi:hypothetical protein